MLKIKTKRRYDSSSRQENALATRHSIIESARQVFLERGYSATTMQVIADLAGVSLDTVYTTVGKKSALFRLLVEMAISGGEDPLPAEEREYVIAIRAEPVAAKKLAIYANSLGAIQPRLAPLFKVLQTAAAADQNLAELWQEISRRRAKNMRSLASDLEKTGKLREGLTVPMVADIIWSMNSPEYYLLLVEERGWTIGQFVNWLSDAWIKLLLKG